MSDFLEMARTGKNDWWRYLLSLPGILLIWLSVGSVPVVLLVFYVMGDGNPGTNVTDTGFVGIPVLLDFVATMLTFIPFIVATLLAVRFIHARPLRTLVTAAPRIRWGRILAGAAVWFGLAALISILEASLYPGRYVLTFQPAALAVYAVVALILIPIQTSSEELFFRGYLLQWTGLLLKNRWVLAIINGALFLLPHVLNPEMGVDGVLVGLSYFAFGFFLALVTLRDNGMELALGVHAANNLYTAILANYTVTAISSPALFTIQTLDAMYGLVSVVIAMFVFYLIFFAGRRPQRVQEAVVE
ncbi:MAG: type II CAAX endopeptidase family protein [Chloroflexota bacterium]